MIIVVNEKDAAYFFQVWHAIFKLTCQL